MNRFSLLRGTKSLVTPIFISRHCTSCIHTPRILSPSHLYSRDTVRSSSAFVTTLNSDKLRKLNRRSYRSQDHNHTPPFPPAATAILASALSHVPAYGFTDTALYSGARDAGYLEASINLFPKGAFDLILYYLVIQRLSLRNSVQFPEDKRLSIGAKVRSLALHRLRANDGVVRHWEQALATMAQPTYVPRSLHELFLLSDEIWHLAGDTSVDSSWYTKRASLSAVYASAEVFMTTDTSAEFAETERFLDRRLEELKVVGGTLSAVGEWAGFSGKTLVNVLRSKGVRI